VLAWRLDVVTVVPTAAPLKFRNTSTGEKAGHVPVVLIPVPFREIVTNDALLVIATEPL
jgi:hypothetical protein